MNALEAAVAVHRSDSRGILKHDVECPGQIHGDWIDFSHKCAHPSLQEAQLRDLIKFENPSDVTGRPESNADKDVQPTGQLETKYASKTSSDKYSPKNSTAS